MQSRKLDEVRELGRLDWHGLAEYCWYSLAAHPWYSLADYRWTLSGGI